METTTVTVERWLEPEEYWLVPQIVTEFLENHVVVDPSSFEVSVRKQLNFDHWGTSRSMEMLLVQVSAVTWVREHAVDEEGSHANDR